MDLIIFAPQIIRCFMDQAYIIEIGAVMMRLLEAGTVVMALTVGINSICQAFGSSLSALLLSTGRQGYVLIIVMLILSHSFGYYGVISAQLVSEIICFVMALIIYMRLLKKIQ